jgi:hypothetical protein
MQPGEIVGVGLMLAPPQGQERCLAELLAQSYGTLVVMNVTHVSVLRDACYMASWNRRTDGEKVDARLLFARYESRARHKKADSQKAGNRLLI